MASKYLTVVYDVSDGSGREILENRQWSAASWSHALDERTAAESAIAELRAEVERWKLLAESYRTLCDVSTDISAVDKILVESSDQRADTAEARLERAERLVTRWKVYGEAMQKSSGNDLARHLIAESAAFLGEGK